MVKSETTRNVTGKNHQYFLSKKKLGDCLKNSKQPMLRN